jgi:hypothetical protein
MWLIVLLAVALSVVVPYALMLLFHGRNRADARGRRVSHAWRTGRRC